MQYLIGVLVGLFISATFNLISKEIHHFGTIEIDASRDDKDIFKMIWNKDPHNIPKFSYITIDIKSASLKELDESDAPVAKK